MLLFLISTNKETKCMSIAEQPCTRAFSQEIGVHVIEPLMIVDFVPFGYEVDKLLLRLMETWDSVDVYVIYEMPFTLLGINNHLYSLVLESNNASRDLRARSCT